MKLERFLREREQVWVELGALTNEARGRPERLGAERVTRLGALYRAASADLALARRRWPGDPSVRRLEGLVARSRQLVYGAQPRRFAPGDFFGRRYWRLVRERPALLIIAALLLIGPALLAGTWAVTDPGNASALVPASFDGFTDGREEGGDLGLSGEEQAAFSSVIFTNNIRVTFLAFAGGIAAGLGTAFILIINGVMVGALSGLAIESGNTRLFLELVSPHGVLEISCIIVCAAAGLRMGWALVDPGHRRRLEAVVEEGRAAVEIVLGTAPWLIIAGLVEGFVTPRGLGFVGAVVFGCALAAVYWIVLFTRGRREPSGEIRGAPAPSL